MKSLRSKLAVSYVVIVLIIVSVFLLFLNVFLQRIFAGYALDKREKQVSQIVKQINQSLSKDIKEYSQELFEIIGNMALQNGFILHINADDTEIDWDIRQHYLEQCKLVLEHAEYNQHSVSPNVLGSYQEETFLLNGGTGTITVGFYGPYNYSNEDVFLIDMINRVVIGITIISPLLAIIIAAVITHRFTTPISNVIDTTKKISKGDFGIQASEASNTKELMDLVEAVNDMSVKLSQLEDTKRRMTSDVAHEIRTPLANLLSQTEAMIDGMLDPSIDRLTSFYEEIERLAKIVNDLQRLTDIENDYVSLNIESFQCKQFMEEIRDLFQIDINNKQISLIITCDSDIAFFADKARLKQIFINLLSNAIKYTPDNGQIKLAASSEGKTVVCSVKDSGIGIPDEDLPYVFERFYRVDKSRTRTTGGAGIGLSIVKKLVELHGGNIEVQSMYGKGTKFTFSINT